jgi:hypothetical protein
LDLDLRVRDIDIRLKELVRETETLKHQLDREITLVERILSLSMGPTTPRKTPVTKPKVGKP